MGFPPLHSEILHLLPLAVTTPSPFLLSANVLLQPVFFFPLLSMACSKLGALSFSHGTAANHHGAASPSPKLRHAHDSSNQQIFLPLLSMASSNPHHLPMETSSAQEGGKAGSTPLCCSHGTSLPLCSCAGNPLKRREPRPSHGCRPPLPPCCPTPSPSNQRPPQLFSMACSALPFVDSTNPLLLHCSSINASLAACMPPARYIAQPRRRCPFSQHDIVGSRCCYLHPSHSPCSTKCLPARRPRIATHLLSLHVVRQRVAPLFPH
jgi:hypothetical protein